MIYKYGLHIINLGTPMPINAFPLNLMTMHGLRLATGKDYVIEKPMNSPLSITLAYIYC